MPCPTHIYVIYSILKNKLVLKVVPLPVTTIFNFKNNVRYFSKKLPFMGFFSFTTGKIVKHLLLLLQYILYISDFSVI